MSFHRICFRQTRANTIKLDEYLRKELPPRTEEFIQGELSNSKIRRLIVAGAVKVDGRQTRIPAFTVSRGSAIEVIIDTEKIMFEKQPEDIAFEMSQDRVVFEDDAIIVVDKPAGIPTEATVVASRDHLHAAVKRFLRARDGTRNEPYVGLHHRLDRETSGVVLFSKNRQVNPACHDIFENHRARKEYEALTVARGAVPDDFFSVDNSLGRISVKSARAQWGAVLSGGERAQTDFRVLERFDHALRILALPLTGRTHQIRVHLSGLGLPLLGDELYGGPATLDGHPIPRVMLHARALSFPHPVTGVAMTARAPLPPDFLECLEFLGSEAVSRARDIRPR